MTADGRTSASLPAGWTTLPLAEVLRPLGNSRLLQQGSSPKCLRQPRSDERAWAVVKSTAVQPGRFVGEHNKQLPGDLTPNPSIEIQPGDLLLTCAGPRSRCAVPCLVRDTAPRLLLSSKIYRFRPDEALVDPRYLELFLLGPGAQRALEAMKTGLSDSGLNLTQSRFLELDVVVPPLPQQRRLIGILQTQLARLTAAEARSARVRRRLSEWRTSAADRLIWAPDHPRRPVSELLREPLRHGHSAPASRTGEGIRTLTLSAVTRADFSEAFTKVTIADRQRVANLWLAPDDILVQRSNTAELVGTTARYDGPDGWTIFPDLMIRVRPDPELVSSRYLTLALSSERAHRQLRQKAKGLSGFMPKIDRDAVGSLRIPVPSAERQAEIVDALAAIAQSSERVRTEVDGALLRSADLRTSLLGAAFSGRLTVSSEESIREREPAGV